MDLNISLSQLESFAKNEGQLPEAALHALTKEFFYNARFNAEKDELVDTSPPPLPRGTPPEPWVNPDPAIAKAQADYKAALAAARPPEPVRSKPLTPGAAKPNPFRRHGFAT